MIPRSFGAYLLLERIAIGGMGEVFIATPKKPNKTREFVALKKLRPGLCEDPESRRRFRHEMRVVLSINHRNVIQVFDAGEVDGECYIVMELLDGKDLDQILWRARACQPAFSLSIPAALYIAREILRGLAYCHRHPGAGGGGLGLIHRDICPPNVLVSHTGAVKIVDFGIAQSADKAANTDPRMVLGHLGYIAPERIRSRDTVVDARADVYSVGALLFQLLTGHRFASGDTLFETFQQARLRQRRPPSQLRATISPAVDALVCRALAFDPDQRFAGADRFHEAVQRELDALDPLFDAKQLSSSVMARLFEPQARERRLRAAARRVAAGRMPETAAPPTERLCRSVSGSTRRVHRWSRRATGERLIPAERRARVADQ